MRTSARQRQVEFDLTEAHVGTDLSEALRQISPDVVFDCTVPEAHVNVTPYGSASRLSRARREITCGHVGKR